MTSRILPQSEWHKLAHTDFPQLLPYIGPEDIDIVVIEDGDRIVGCWGVMPMIHLEGVWIAPEYRGKGSVARRLVRSTWAEIKRRAPRWVMTAAADDTVRSLITKHFSGLRIPGEAYLIPMHGEKRCQSLL